MPPPVQQGAKLLSEEANIAPILLLQQTRLVRLKLEQPTDLVKENQQIPTLLEEFELRPQQTLHTLPGGSRRPHRTAALPKETFKPLVEEMLNDCGLRWEVLIEGPLPDIGRFRNVLDGGLVYSILGE